MVFGGGGHTHQQKNERAPNMLSSSGGKWHYPNTRRDESAIDEHGLGDPYRWHAPPLHPIKRG